jgi:hypothetical protein
MTRKTLSLWLALSIRLMAHDIITTNLTFTRDIARIFDRHCAGCHGPGASISFSTYEEARPWAVAIKEQVLTRAMPPWGAVKGFGNLKPDHALTQEEIMIVAAWVIGGAPQGDPALLPKQAHGKPADPPPALREVSTAGDQTVLAGSLRLMGIRPLAESPIESARITARLPDGRILPLVWLSRFDPKWKQTFVFREALNLPKGTVLRSTTPVRFVLETAN